MLLLEKYDFKIKYRVEILNLVNDLSRQLNYENEQLNNIYLSTLQRKLRNVVVININLDKKINRN